MDPGAPTLRIDSVAAQIREASERIERELPADEELRALAGAIGRAAAQAKRVTTRSRRWYSAHRLPAIFLLAALLSLLGWLYYEFVHVSTLTLALPERDAAGVRESLAARSRLKVVVRDVRGSREAAELVARGDVDLAYVQGTIPLPPRLPRRETADRVLLLWLLRDGVPGVASVKRVLTSYEGEASHTAAGRVFELLHQQVTWVHGWPDLLGDPGYAVPADVDAVLVAKDPSDEHVLDAIERLCRSGFHLASLHLGVRGGRVPAFSPATLAAGELRPDPPLPVEPIATYGVTAYLVARQGLTPRLLSAAAYLVSNRSPEIASIRLDPNAASELLQGLDALLSILVNIVIGFVALLGLDAWLYRRPLFELNSLVSTISLLQSHHDVVGVSAARRDRAVQVLLLCGDLLGLVSAINAYYTQENSSLLFNNLAVIIHQRCDALKLNIQLKLVEAATQGVGEVGVSASATG